MRALAMALALVAGTAAAELPPLAVTVHSGGTVFLAPSRTQGGLGGGVGLALSVDAHWLVEADATVLFGLGLAGQVRAGAAWQRSGRWTPVARAYLELAFGQRLDFTVNGRLPPNGPTLGLGVGLGLLRFTVGRATVSALELRGGLGTDFLSVGPHLGVELLELSLPL
jgi:hypothetical protein